MWPPPSPVGVGEVHIAGADRLPQLFFALPDDHLCSVMCLIQGDHTWATMLGQSVKLQLVPIQSLSELERARLQEVAFYHLEERDLDFNISIPRGTALTTPAPHHHPTTAH
ncbi:hypothetical protein JZ751_018710 [Albula glossodonta]|uniref:Uncharacterized protein n=1 Tax=Albula glossodonta TaxID=121402 RepID=A0A8T2NZ37_9TELE|nr:hypothetical protein JZ751_018710 [Albula glossodonta]